MCVSHLVNTLVPSTLLWSRNLVAAVFEIYLIIDCQYTMHNRGKVYVLINLICRRTSVICGKVSEIGSLEEEEDLQLTI